MVALNASSFSESIFNNRDQHGGNRGRGFLAQHPHGLLAMRFRHGRIYHHSLICNGRERFEYLQRSHINTLAERGRGKGNNMAFLKFLVHGVDFSRKIYSRLLKDAESLDKIHEVLMAALLLREYGSRVDGELQHLAPGPHAVAPIIIVPDRFSPAL